MAEYIPEPFIETYLGKKFVFSDPTDDMVNILDIAHALGNLCRYNGHCLQFYSVAEHCVLLTTKYMSFNPDDRETAKSFLLHDAAEAYLCDCPRPIKYTLPQFREAEAKIEAAIVKKFKLKNFGSPIIKDWDSRICHDERLQAMSKSGNTWGVDHLEPLGIELKFWTPKEASSRFLLLFKALNI